MAGRKVFEELMGGVEAMKKHREGKLTLRSYKVEARERVAACEGRREKQIPRFARNDKLGAGEQ